MGATGAVSAGGVPSWVVLLGGYWAVQISRVLVKAVCLGSWTACSWRGSVVGVFCDFLGWYFLGGGKVRIDIKEGI